MKADLQHIEHIIDKLDIEEILSQFSAYAILESTKKKFIKPVLLHSVEEYDRVKAAALEYRESVYNESKIRDYDIEGIDDILVRCLNPSEHFLPKDLYAMRECLNYIMPLVKRKHAFLKNIADYDFESDNVSSLLRSINRVIDKDGNVLDGASELLKSIRKEKEHLLRDQQKIIKTVLQKYESSLMASNITLIDARFVLQVDTHKRDQVNGILHNYSNTQKTVFIEPDELVIYNNRLTEIEYEEKAEIARIMRDVFNLIAGDGIFPVALRIAVILLDYYNAIAAYEDSRNAAYINAGRDIQLYYTYHPVLYSLNKENAVPLNIHIKEKQSLLITGPNMGGKTVMLKTIGICALFMRMGLPSITSENSVMPFYKRILVDIGDDQSVDEGVSTFASHLLNYGYFAQQASENTLILLDEIGTGTSVKEGSAFAVSVIDYLISKGSTVLFTSHFDYIKEYAMNSDSIECASMRYDVEENRPLYEIQMHTLGDSNVLNIVKKYGMPEEIIRMTKSRLGDDYIDYSKLTGIYREKLAEISKQAEVIEKQKKAIEKIEMIVKAQQAAIDEKKKRIEKEYSKKKSAEIEKLRSDFERIVKEIKESNASKENVIIGREFIRGAETSGKSAEQEEEFEPAAQNVFFTIGDLVVMNNNIEGYVESIDGDNVTVNINGVRLNTKRKFINGKAHRKATEDLKSSITPEAESNQLDIRGMYPDDAIERVEKYLYDVSAAGFKEVMIIHGHGTGVLKKAIRRYLKTLKFIKEFNPGIDLPGGDGVTVVKLK